MGLPRGGDWPVNRAAQGRYKHAGPSEPVINHCNDMRKVSAVSLSMFPISASFLPLPSPPGPGNNVCAEGLSFPELGVGGGGCL